MIRQVAIAAYLIGGNFDFLFNRKLGKLQQVVGTGVIAGPSVLVEAKRAERKVPVWEFVVGDYD